MSQAACLNSGRLPRIVGLRNALQIALLNAEVRMGDRELAGIPDERRHIVSTLERLRHQFFAGPAGGAENQNPSHELPSAGRQRIVITVQYN